MARDGNPDSYAKEREQFEQQMGKLRLAFSKIEEMEARLESRRALLYTAAWLRSFPPV